MATQMDYGLFGATPDQLEQAQRQQQNDAALQYARMNPDERNSYLMYQAGSQLAKPILGMMGYQHTPTVQAKQRQDVARQFDTTTADGMMKVAAEFNRLGMPNEAQLAVQKAREMKAEESRLSLQESQVSLHEAQAEKARRIAVTEYERWAEVANDPDSTPQEVEMAKKRMAVLDAKGMGGAARGTTARKTFNTPTGVVIFDPQGKTGENFLHADGTPLTSEEAKRLVAASNDPELQMRLAEVKKGGAEAGKNAAAAQNKIPSIEQSIAQATYLGDQLFAHPGYTAAIGTGLPFMSAITGTEAKGAKALYEQLTSGAFLTAAENLRGLGQMTEVEGTKATQAVTRMSNALSEKDFRAAYNDYVKFMKLGLAKAQKQASSGYKPTFSAQPVVAPTSGYSGGSPAAAAQDQRAILEAELKKTTNPQDIATIKRELARLPGAGNVPTAVVNGKTYYKPDNMSEAQWREYKKAVGAK